MKEEGRSGGTELGSDLDLNPDQDPWKMLWFRIWIRQNDVDPLDPQFWFVGDTINVDVSRLKKKSACSLWMCTAWFTLRYSKLSFSESLKISKHKKVAKINNAKWFRPTDGPPTTND